MIIIINFDWFLIIYSYNDLFQLHFQSVYTTVQLQYNYREMCLNTDVFRFLSLTLTSYINSVLTLYSD